MFHLNILVVSEILFCLKMKQEVVGKRNFWGFEIVRVMFKTIFEATENHAILGDILIIETRVKYKQM